MNDFQYATACGVLGIGLVVYVQLSQGLAKQPFWQQADLQLSQQQIEQQQQAIDPSPTISPTPTPAPQNTLEISDYELSDTAPDVDWAAVTDPAVQTRVVDRLGQCIGSVENNQFQFIKINPQYCGDSDS
jgi:hypothetical protein